jgi:Tetrapyrrole (Corrin/Porphyrin) Methylases
VGLRNAPGNCYSIPCRMSSVIIFLSFGGGGELLYEEEIQLTVHRLLPWFPDLNMLYLVGLGLADEKDITVRGLEVVKAASRVYLEAYTSILLIEKEKLVGCQHFSTDNTHRRILG